MQKNRFYGFQSDTGTGVIFVFNKKENARKWAASAERCTMKTKAELRKKYLGISIQDFNEILRTARAYDEGEE